KFRLYPNKEQEILISKTIGCSRFVFNYFLNLWNEEYKKTGKGLSYNKCATMIPALKKSDEYNWLKEVDSIALQSSVKNLEDSFNRFFKKQNKRNSISVGSSKGEWEISKSLVNGIRTGRNWGWYTKNLDRENR